MRTVDKSKKSNIKCEHCQYGSGSYTDRCKLTGEPKHYYNRCKRFEWHKKYDEQEKQS